MSLVSEIAQWADAHSLWMSDAVRRLVRDGELQDDDIDDLESFIRLSAGLPVPDAPAPRRVLLSELPQLGVPGSAISLTAIREPKNINAIGNAELITMNPQGLNVIYGYNGSGKSGYARALKKACRARKPEPIHPNVFVAATKGPASAIFEWSDGTNAFSQQWVDDVTPPADLSQIAVFDAHCARVFIDEQAAISYIPYGMDMLTHLSTALGTVQRRLSDQRQRQAFDRSSLQHLHGATEVGRLVSALSRLTRPDDVRRLATLNPEETTELQQIQQLAQNDVGQKMARQLRLFRTRLDSVLAELLGLRQALGDPSVEALRLSFVRLLAAHKASQQAATAFIDGYLQGTGTESWEVLMNSAIEFARLSYPDQPFPGPPDAACVLCQQPLATDGMARMRKFFSFLQEDCQATYKQQRAQTIALYEPIAKAPAKGFPSDKAFVSELSERVADLSGLVTTYVQALQDRQGAIISMAPDRIIGDLPALPDDPAPGLMAYRDSLSSEIARLEQAMTPQRHAQLTQRIEELGARVKLQASLPTVLAAIEAAELDWRLGEAIKSCNTAALTKKHGELYQKTVTADLQDALQRELTAVGVHEIKLDLDLAGQRGKQMQQLRLVTANQALKIKPSGVLSEGEQRAIALASFLAEVSLEPGRSAIVLDDPVTSLDHRRRERIARRLAREAQARQVIVFTHDLAFAHELMESAKKEGHRATVRHVFAAFAVKGRCDDKLPFEAQKVTSRINDLKAAHQRASKALEKDNDHDAYNEIVRSGYRKLRDSWELLVEDHLFAGTLKRFRRPIATLKLRSVCVEDEHVKAVYEGMTRASYFTHEGGREAPPSLPEPHEFLADIEALETTLKMIEDNRKQVEARREKLGMPG